MSLKGHYKLHSQRAGSAPAFVTWLLITGFLLQPILTYLATPMLVADRTGNMVLICTLYGLQTVNVDSPQGGDQTNEYLCPALSLLHSANSGQTSLPPTLPTITAHTMTRDICCAEQHQNREYFHAFLTRAPPHLS